LVRSNDTNDPKSADTQKFYLDIFRELELNLEEVKEWIQDQEDLEDIVQDFQNGMDDARWIDKEREWRKRARIWVKRERKLFRERLEYKTRVEAFKLLSRMWASRAAGGIGNPHEQGQGEQPQAAASSLTDTDTEDFDREALFSLHTGV
jgi:hypothetical protein